MAVISQMAHISSSEIKCYSIYIVSITMKNVAFQHTACTAMASSWNGYHMSQTVHSVTMKWLSIRIVECMKHTVKTCIT